MEEILKYQTDQTKFSSSCCLHIKESLLKAALMGDFRGVRGLMLCPDANINSIDDRGRTPIYLASWMNHLRVVEVLLNGTNIDVNRGSKNLQLGVYEMDPKLL